ncbi:hypothetical protein PSN45_000066 [Yamadazyma tenuis]|uniref:EamA domain-containing protein n=1 Tax=Candida tenuis (strain ATCC 10573 / BCRC 21748 / CBS 615 / JCM 9827 / NBRC 10315 / NRRL Y-1498 / VKM Y-70) TaxID=590646 RepID=G3BAA5_CANTC|nr:uncharacterized protein CANTEDRAFT_107494 [Yamadazyma tenuis ATCC 10573]EGV61393.1 hypothetical protein CANTEDRAFT_107494 [Yamadazyma tenuis ATCC 10573]WEJ92613.1 hypothetical protein PSN45_000066 [Yamadazyma tenuis]
MSVTVDQHQTDGHSKTKIVFISVLFVLSLTMFVLQTEFTSQAYTRGFKEPIILLIVTHGSWWTLWPLQVLSVAVYRVISRARRAIDPSKPGYQPLSSTTELLPTVVAPAPINPNSASPPPPTINYWLYFKKAIVKQFHNIYHTSIIIYEYHVNDDDRIHGINQLIDQHPHISSTPSITACVVSFVQTPSIQYILWKTFVLVLLLTVAGFTWYGSMALTYAADVTAIYNCSAFTAYIFAIPLLNERFSWLKANSVLIAIVGVFIVSYSDSSDGADTPYPYRFWGNLAISIGAVLYGLYEVFYKKFLCIPPHLSKLITPKRQMVFANFVMSLLGLYTAVILLVGCILVDILGIHKFNLVNYDGAGVIWGYIAGSIVSNLSFSASFLSLISLTNPVLSSVSSLLTIFLIGVVEWWLFDNVLSTSQLVGDVLVIIGFVLLTVASWNEISEGEDSDEMEVVSNYSFAISTSDDSQPLR